MFAKPLRGLHVFWMIFTFFAVVVSVDTLFIVRAVGTFPGEEVQNSYVLGLDYNNELARRHKQESLGWQAEAGLRTEGGPMLVVRVATQDKSPVAGLQVSVGYRKIGKDGEEQFLKLVERASGEYAAPVPAISAGRIELNIAAGRAGSNVPVFEAVKILVIR